MKGSELQEGLHPRKEFAISPKTTYQFLESMISSGTEIDVLHRVGNDVLLNARELVPNADWDLMHTKHLKFEKTIVKQRSVDEKAPLIAIARTILDQVVNDRLNMDSPQIVVISGEFIVTEINKRLSVLQGRLDDIESGVSLYMEDGIQKDEENKNDPGVMRYYRAEAAEKKRAEISKLERERLHIREGIDQYSGKNGMLKKR